MSKAKKQTAKTSPAKPEVAASSYLVEKTSAMFNRSQPTDRADDGKVFGRKSELDELTRWLGCSGYYHKMTWPWFKQQIFGIEYRLSVDRFYHERNIAMDFAEPNEEHRLTKEKLFKEKGIEYITAKSAHEFKVKFGALT